MSAADLLLVLLGVLALGAAVALTLTAVRLHRVADAAELTRRALEESVRDLEELRRAFTAEAAEELAALHAAATRAERQVDDVEALLEVSSAIGDRVDATTEAAYRALTSPVIKTVALASGTRRAARRLRPHR